MPELAPKMDVEYNLFTGLAYYSGIDYISINANSLSSHLLTCDNYNFVLEVIFNNACTHFPGTLID